LDVLAGLPKPFAKRRATPATVGCWNGEEVIVFATAGSNPQWDSGASLDQRTYLGAEALKNFSLSVAN
jgi:hypothetical protein